eukprot:PITA_19477
MYCKEDLAREFEMKDMGLMHYFLSMEVWQKNGWLFVFKGKYANEILRRFHMENFKSIQTPLAGNWRKDDATSGEVVEATVYRKLVGSLMYLVNTQLNLCYAMNQLSQEGVKLQGFTDADWEGSPLDRKSTSGGIFSLGPAAISWYNRKQRSLALNSAEAEYMAASQATCEAIWMRKILVGLYD